MTIPDPFRGATQVIPAVRTAYVAGGSAGNHTLSGITLKDSLLSVHHISLTEGAPNTFSAVEDLTSEFSITAADTINNTGGTDTTGGLLAVSYYDEDLGRESEPPWNPA